MAWLNLRAHLEHSQAGDVFSIHDVVVNFSLFDRDILRERPDNVREFAASEFSP